MTLAEHDNFHRRLWMFPRNIRRIEPWKISQILTLFIQFINDYGTLRGNQELQNDFCKALENAGLKRTGFQYNKHTGGIRTYLAQLRSLGLIFTRIDGSVWLTKAGQDIVNGNPPLLIMQKLLLRYQYPSIYSENRNVKINRAIKIKPFLFVLQILMNEDIQYLTNEELAVAVIFGHNFDCYNLCIDKILLLRSGKKLSDIVEDEDCYTPRTAGRSKDKSIVDILNIANTCKNYLQACCLVDVENKAGEPEKIYFNKDMELLVNEAILKRDVFITADANTKNEEEFQREFGAWDGKKDTRRLIQQECSIINARNSIITANFYSYAGRNLISSFPEEFISKTVNNFGFSREQVIEAITPHLEKSLSYFEASFLEYSKSGTSKATEFEKAIISIFKDKFNFETHHTGQLRRSSNSVGGYADILILDSDRKYCALIDAKATAHYSLPSNDYYKMKDNYIRNYTELDTNNSALEFCTYIAGGFSKGFTGKIQTLSRETGIPISGVSAYELLNIAKLPQAQRQDVIRKKFKMNKIITANDIIS